MSVNLWFYKDDIDEEDHKVMFDVLVRELFAFILHNQLVLGLGGTHWVRRTLSLEYVVKSEETGWEHSTQRYRGGPADEDGDNGGRGGIAMVIEDQQSKMGKQFKIQIGGFF